MKRLAQLFALVAILALAIGHRARAQQANNNDIVTSPGPPTQVFDNADRVFLRVRPSDTDPQLHRYLKDHVVLIEHGTPTTAPLFLFMPGTGGVPWEYLPFLTAASKAGYRVAGLVYDDIPAVAQVCQSRSDATCSGLFREKRIFGKDVSKDIDDLPEESIVNRLTKLLQYLDAQYPNGGWGGYLVNGQPNWERIAVSGHSQGAGMAAMIAKRYLVDRVVLLSGPWDHYAPYASIAPWVKDASATPPDRWYAAYHQREHEADTLKRAYKELGVPADHIRVFTLEPNWAAMKSKPDPKEDYYHGTEATDLTPLKPDGTPAYADDWAFLLGAAK